MSPNDVAVFLVARDHRDKFNADPKGGSGFSKEYSLTGFKKVSF